MEIYINNKKYDANDKETIIQVADRNNIHIPRFCYHERLSVVASCRMCLVEMEGVKISSARMLYSCFTRYED